MSQSNGGSWLSPQASPRPFPRARVDADAEWFAGPLQPSVSPRRGLPCVVMADARRHPRSSSLRTAERPALAFPKRAVLAMRFALELRTAADGSPGRHPAGSRVRERALRLGARPKTSWVAGAD